MKIQRFIESRNVKMTAAWVDRNPNMDDMPPGSSHWKCVLRRGNLRMTVHFSQGPAISKEPTVADVLDCLASDASSVENARSFEDWAGEMGFSEDSRKAEKIFKVCERQAESLKRLLGGDYETLLYKTERG